LNFDFKHGGIGNRLIVQNSTICLPVALQIKIQNSQIKIQNRGSGADRPGSAENAPHIGACHALAL
jgi:hypothetical protein